MSEQVHCPACGALVGFRRLSPKGLWEKSLALLGGFTPYKCEVCLNRILRRGPLPARPVGVKPAPGMRAHAPFAEELDTDDFGAFIEEIAATERRRSLDKLPTP